jgi:hypothetical protein
MTLVCTDPCLFIKVHVFLFSVSCIFQIKDEVFNNDIGDIFNTVFLRLLILVYKHSR